MRIILASKSPRRKSILENIGIQFDVIESNFDEKIEEIKTPEDTVKYLSYKKAESVAQNLKKSEKAGTLVIGADTVVVLDSEILGKPKSYDDAFGMLRRLSGKWHSVYTGICVYNVYNSKYAVDFETTRVKIKSLTPDEINRYIERERPYDKAGSYAIQGYGSLIVEKINGCYFNVVGLPVFKLSNLLMEFGVKLL